MTVSSGKNIFLKKKAVKSVHAKIKSQRISNFYFYIIFPYHLFSFVSFFLPFFAVVFL